MNIDWTSFPPWSALAVGAMVAGMFAFERIEAARNALPRPLSVGEGVKD